MFLKVLNAARNLKNLVVDDDNMTVMDLVPREKYHLLANCTLCMDSVEQQIQYLEFALAVTSVIIVGNNGTI